MRIINSASLQMSFSRPLEKCRSFFTFFIIPLTLGLERGFFFSQMALLSAWHHIQRDPQWILQKQNPERVALCLQMFIKDSGEKAEWICFSILNKMFYFFLGAHLCCFLFSPCLLLGFFCSHFIDAPLFLPSSVFYIFHFASGNGVHFSHLLSCPMSNI